MFFTSTLFISKQSYALDVKDQSWQSGLTSCQGPGKNIAFSPSIADKAAAGFYGCYYFHQASTHFPDSPPVLLTWLNIIHPEI